MAAVSRVFRQIVSMEVILLTNDGEPPKVDVEGVVRDAIQSGDHGQHVWLVAGESTETALVEMIASAVPVAS